MPVRRAETAAAVHKTTSEWHMLAHSSAVPDVGPLESKHSQIVIPGEIGAQHNPTVFVSDGDLGVVVRVLNGLKTTNYMGELDVDGCLAWVRKMTRDESLAKGQLEDLRVFRWQDRLWAIAASHAGDKILPVAIRQALLELDGSHITKRHELPSVRHEKNWMPCVTEEGLKLVYSINPLIVLDVDEMGGGTTPNAMAVPQVTGHIRGGSQLIEYDGGWLAIVHQVHRPVRETPNHNGLLGFWAPLVKDPVAGHAPVVYLHRFAKFDAGLTRVSLGAPFYFRHLGVEFCCGLVAWNDAYVASFGVADKEAWTAIITRETIERTFG